MGGGAGNDYVSGRYGDDGLFGGEGDDLIFGDTDEVGTGARQFAIYGTGATGNGAAPAGSFTFVGTGGPAKAEALDDDDLFQDVSGAGGSDVDATGG